MICAIVDLLLKSNLELDVFVKKKTGRIRSDDAF